MYRVDRHKWPFAHRFSYLNTGEEAVDLTGILELGHELCQALQRMLGSFEDMFLDSIISAASCLVVNSSLAIAHRQGPGRKKAGSTAIVL